MDWRVLNLFKAMTVLWLPWEGSKRASMCKSNFACLYLEKLPLRTVGLVSQHKA